MSPDQSEGVFDARGRAGDRARAWAVPHYAGPMTERTNGLAPARSRGAKPTDGSRDYIEFTSRAADRYITDNCDSAGMRGLTTESQ